MVFKGRLLENHDTTMVLGYPLEENADSTMVFKGRGLKKAGRFLKNADTRLKTQGFLIKILALGCPGKGFPVESVAVSDQAQALRRSSKRRSTSRNEPEPDAKPALQHQHQTQQQRSSSIRPEG